MENPKHLECLLWGQPVVSTDLLNFIFVFDTHKTVSTPSKASSQRIQNWANNSYLATFRSSTRYIAFVETVWSDASSRWITPPASARAIAFSAPLPREYKLVSVFFIRPSLNQAGAGSPHLSETRRATQREIFSTNRPTVGARKHPPTDHVREEERMFIRVLHRPVVRLPDKMVRSSHMVNHVKRTQPISWLGIYPMLPHVPRWYRLQVVPNAETAPAAL